MGLCYCSLRVIDGRNFATILYLPQFSFHIFKTLYSRLHFSKYGTDLNCKHDCLSLTLCNKPIIYCFLAAEFDYEPTK
jgi:hypothetical protein